MIQGINKAHAKAKAIRLPLVEKYYTRSYTIRQIQQKVKEELGLTVYAYNTARSDIKTIQQEWKEARIEDMNAMRDKQYRESEAIKRECWDMHISAKERGEGGDLHALAEVRNNNRHEAEIYGLMKGSPSVAIQGTGITVNLVDSPEAREVQQIWDEDIEDIG